MRTGYRAVVLGTALVVVGAFLPTAAGAAPPRTVSTTDLTLLCTGSGPAGSVELALDVSVDVGGERTGGFLLVSDADGDLSSISAEGQGTVLRNGGALSGGFPMLDATTGRPVGDAEFAVEVSSAGGPTTTNDRTRTGNSWQSVTVIRQPLAGAGSVQLATGGTVDVECSGAESHISVRTMPEAFVQRLDGVDIGDPGPECVTDLGEGRFLVLAAEGLGHYVSVAVVSGDGVIAGDSEQAVTSRGRVSATIPLVSFDGEGGGQHVGDAVVALQVGQVTGRESWVLRSQYRTQRTTRHDVVMTGTVLLPGGESVAIACEGRRFVTQEVATSPSGPKPGGPPPANDAPAGAVTLLPGGRATVQTGGAAPTPEVDQWCYDNVPQDPGFYPRHSVWFRFTGTGGPVTVDTAGSGFNTTVAVYEGTPSAAAEIACVDDDGPPVRTYQAYTTVETVAGASYFVQVAGLGGEYGLLRIALR